MREVGQPSAVGLLPVLAVLARTEFFARLSREEAAVAFRRRSIPRLLSLDLQDLILIQDANPQPPVLEIPKLSASVEWEALLFGRLVANLSVDRPTLYVDRAHFRQEITDEVPIEARGQEALQAIYPRSAS
jgi:hypothetical protein